ncbi:MAG: hypothetical protein IPN63_07060 [Gammaproteobacteria bacterium]|nr:hypothetical protein [Gammaproteobacteria bacterium]
MDIGVLMLFQRHPNLCLTSPRHLTMADGQIRNEVAKPTGARAGRSAWARFAEAS